MTTTKNKSVAIIAVLALCCTAWMGVAMVSDDSEAASYTAYRGGSVTIPTVTSGTQFSGRIDYQIGSGTAQTWVKNDSNIAGIYQISATQAAIVFTSTATTGTYTIWPVMVGDESGEDLRGSAQTVTLNSTVRYTHIVKYSGWTSTTYEVVTNTTSGNTNMTLKSSGIDYRSGYDFDGWEVRNTSTKVTSVSVGSGVSNMVTVDARWTEHVAVVPVLGSESEPLESVNIWPWNYSEGVEIYAKVGATVNLHGYSDEAEPDSWVCDSVTSGYGLSVVPEGDSFWVSSYGLSGTLTKAGTITSTWSIYFEDYRESTVTITIHAVETEKPLEINSVAKQYGIAGNSINFGVGSNAATAGKTVTYSVSNVPSGLTVNVNGSTITCNSASVGTYTFTLTASASGYTTASTTVTVQFVPALAFTNTPSAGALNA